MTELNPLIWFTERELDFVPKHFVKAPTPVNSQSLFWVKSTLTGRYSCQANHESNVIFHESTIIYFEDPKELTIYELRWAGANIF